MLDSDSKVPLSADEQDHRRSDIYEDLCTLRWQSALHKVAVQTRQLLGMSGYLIKHFCIVCINSHGAVGWSDSTSSARLQTNYATGRTTIGFFPVGCSMLSGSCLYTRCRDV